MPKYHFHVDLPNDTNHHAKQHHVKAPDVMWNDMLRHLDHRQMAELVLTVGFYMMVCRFLENFEVDIEP